MTGRLRTSTSMATASPVPTLDADRPRPTAMFRTTDRTPRCVRPWLVALVCAAVGLVPTGLVAAERLQRSPGAVDASTPVLLASSDCTDDGRTGELMQFEVRNVDVVDHEVEVVFDGDVIARETVVAGGRLRDRVPVKVSWDDLPLSARFVDVGESSPSMLVRPSRCITRVIGRSTGPRVNGPAGVLGLVCLRGALHVEFDVQNVDIVTRSMSINLYSEGRRSVNDVEVVERRPVPAGGRLRGVVPYPFGADGFPSGYEGDTLVRAWFRDVVDDPVEQYAYHARVWYEETPPCVPPLDGRAMAAARLMRSGELGLHRVQVLAPPDAMFAATVR